MVQSEMDGLTVGGHAGFLECFGQSWMGATSSGEILRAGSVLNADDSLRDHFSCSWTHNVGSKELVSLLVGENLDHAVGVRDSLSSGVGQEGEDSFAVLDVSDNKIGTFSLEFFLVVAHCGNFGVGIDDSRDGQVVDMGVLSCDLLGHEDAFFFSLVSQHGTSHDVTNS